MWLIMKQLTNLPTFKHLCNHINYIIWSYEMYNSKKKTIRGSHIRQNIEPTVF